MLVVLGLVERKAGKFVAQHGEVVANRRFDFFT
jgi:hypothetical protein